MVYRGDIENSNFQLDGRVKKNSAILMISASFLSSTQRLKLEACVRRKR